jgi:hypothetical protein
MVDGLADVYEGRLQQADKLYLAGISQTVRSAVPFVVFAVTLFVFRSLPVSTIAFADNHLFAVSRGKLYVRRLLRSGTHQGLPKSEKQG